MECMAGKRSSNRNTSNGSQNDLAHAEKTGFAKPCHAVTVCAGTQKRWQKHSRESFEGICSYCGSWICPSRCVGHSERLTNHLSRSINVLLAISAPFLIKALLSCPVLSCPVLSCPVLSCPVLSCPVLSCPVLSCPVLSCPVLSCPVLSCLHCVPTKIKHDEQSHASI